MTDDKMKEILKAMSGITYQEWRKLMNTVELDFSHRARNVSDKLIIADPGEIISLYELNYNFSSQQPE